MTSAGDDVSRSVARASTTSTPVRSSSATSVRSTPSSGDGRGPPRRTPSDAVGSSSSVGIVPKDVNASRTRDGGGGLDQWLSWRRDVNAQLATYTKQRQGNRRASLSNYNLPPPMNSRCVNAILQRAHANCETETSLDNLSYIIYGIPRVAVRNLREHDVPNDVVPKWSPGGASSRAESRVASCSTPTSGGSDSTLALQKPPPVAGAVATALSGLRPPIQPQLRRVCAPGCDEPGHRHVLPSRGQTPSRQ